MIASWSEVFSKYSDFVKHIQALECYQSNSFEILEAEINGLREKIMPIISDYISHLIQKDSTPVKDTSDKQNKHAEPYERNTKAFTAIIMLFENPDYNN